MKTACLLCCLSTLLIFGCTPGEPAPETQQDTPEKAAGLPEGRMEITGTVVFKELEGGFYAIDSDDGEKYNPVNLPAAFRKEGLRVKASARPYDGMSMHMYGTLVEIDEISPEER